MEADERTKGARKFQGVGRSAKVLGNYWGAIGIDEHMGYQRIVIEPYWQYYNTEGKYGGRVGPISDEEMFPFFDDHIVCRSWICGDSLSTQCSYIAKFPEEEHKL